jgi:hypothetical protein
MPDLREQQGISSTLRDMTISPSLVALAMPEQGDVSLREPPLDVFGFGIRQKEKCCWEPRGVLLDVDDRG